MFRDLFTTRAILAGGLFFVLVVASSLLYSWHIRSQTAAELARSVQVIQQLERGEAHTSHDAEPSTDTDSAGGVPVALDTDTLQTVPETEMPLLQAETPDPLDVGAGPLPDDTVQETPEETRVSPFGFGPYPEIPPGYPDPDLWDLAESLYEFSPERARNWELRERVCIKLWKQGKQAESVAMENGLVYPLYPNTVYVRWDQYIDEEGTPVRYIAETLGSGDMARYDDDFDNSIIPPGITVIPYAEGGIEPYTFLNLK